MDKPISDGPNDLKIIAIAVVSLLVILILLWAKSYFSKGKDLILMMGISNAGKTHMFSKLVFDSGFTYFHTSISENVSPIKLASKKELSLIDIPSLKLQTLDKYKSNTRAIIFVVDSSTFVKDLKEVSELIYLILTERALKKCPILVACNKQDIILSKSSAVVKSLLEKEICILRKTRSAALDGGSGFLGNPNTPFTFDKDLKGRKATFVESSALKLESLEDVRAFVEKL